MRFDTLAIIRNNFFELYLFFFFAIVTLIFYGSSLNNFFVLDDFVRLKAVSEGQLHENFHFFPVPLLLYRVVYLIFGMEPYAYKILNYAVNSVFCVYVFKFSYSLFENFGKDKNEKNIFLKSFLCSTLFSIHYIHVETVVYFSELHELLYALFYIMGLYAYLQYIKDGRKFHFVSIFIFYTLCIFSKETAVTFIAVIFLGEIFLYKKSFISFIKNYSGLIIITGVFVILRYFLYPKFDNLEYSFNLLTLTLESFKNIVFTFTAFLFSLDFMAIKDIYKTAGTDLYSTFSIVVKTYPIAIAALVLTAYFYILALKMRDKVSIISFIFVLVTIVSFIWLAGYERYLYLPSVGFWILFVNYIFNSKLISKKYLLLLIISLIGAYNIYNLEVKESNWVIASEISRIAVRDITAETNGIPYGSIVYFKDLPGDYKGAWILRYGIHQLPELFVNRKDLSFYYLYEYKPENTKQPNLYIYDYNDKKLKNLNNVN